jgi:hypothetical protein
LDEEWDDATGMSGTNNGLDASWTAFGAAQTRSYASANLVLLGTASGGASANVTGLWKTAPSTPYTVIVPVSLCGSAQYNFTMLGLRRGSTGYLLTVFLYLTAGAILANVSGYTAVTTRNRSDLYNAAWGTRDAWLRLTNNGTNATFYLSTSGVAGTFLQVYTETLATQFSTDVPDQYFIGLDPYSTTAPLGKFGPVRVT